MKCIILAAGYATRLYPLTENFPKPLLPVGGKPILDWLISDLERRTEEVLVVTNHKFADAFKEWASDKKNVRIVDDGTVSNDTRLGAVRDIQLAAKGIEDDTFVMAGDNVLDFSLVPFVDYAAASGTSCVMCHEENRLEALQRTAVITMDQHQVITSYEEKPKEPKGNLAVPPFYFYRAQDLSRIQDALDSGCNADAPGSFAAWLSRQVPMHAWKMTGSRYDIGDMASYQAIRDCYQGTSIS